MYDVWNRVHERGDACKKAMNWKKNPNIIKWSYKQHDSRESRTGFTKGEVAVQSSQPIRLEMLSPLFGAWVEVSHFVIQKKQQSF